MEKRPPSGIWGGLWCFIEVQDDSEISQKLQTQNLRVISQQTLPPFRHTFSHFHLDIQPIIVECKKNTPQEINDNQAQQWYDLTTKNAVGLAASTQKLIIQLKQHH